MTHTAPTVAQTRSGPLRGDGRLFNAGSWEDTDCDDRDGGCGKGPPYGTAGVNEPQWPVSHSARKARSSVVAGMPLLCG